MFNLRPSLAWPKQPSLVARALKPSIGFGSSMRFRKYITAIASSQLVATLAQDLAPLWKGADPEAKPGRRSQIGGPN